MFSLESFSNVLTIICFCLEAYHIVGHCAVLFRVRLLPRKDLVRIRYYFLIDLMTVFVSSFVVLGRLQWLAVIQMCQHMYYFLFWEQTGPAKKIISWSSIDWTKSKFYKEWHLDSILGTAFDVGVHVLMAFLLGQRMTTVQVIIGLVIVQCSSFTIMNGPWLAWSNPWDTPKWIEKRVKPLQTYYSSSQD
ncbi:uncharacterized protein LOC127725787 [Mytilus californianus]|uniref:uncharacterized protein LOC127725787 n=1 Tax=Mytilus californianus TaxID=6549 RepID=UPI002247F764|nr:uncharacterized protein LOC127725787 [Mytilus californianus]